MLYHLLYPLNQDYGIFNIFRYITFRSVAAFLIASIISIIWGKYFIRYFRDKHLGQVIRKDGPGSHLSKVGTPTMGGLFILGSIFITMLIAGNFSSVPVISTAIVTVSYFVLGFIDDFLKMRKKNSDGISVKGKLLWQFLTAISVGYYLCSTGTIDTKLYSPFLKGALFDVGNFYILFIALVVVGTSNAVNLTDGLDGLAIGPIIVSAATLGVFVYACGHSEISEYLYIPYVRDAGELLVITCAIVGAGVGFLWYNSHPAEVFMGDVGSLSLGGALGIMAVISKNELLFAIIGGVFVIEALSVILQVASYKLRKKRIFKMAPIHHHFELLGWPEPKVIVRFWIISIFLSLLALATLKIR